MPYVIVFLGAGLGGALRHGVNVAAERLLGQGFPLGTLVVNVGGSFLMGVLAGYFAFRPGLPQDLRVFLTTGILGGFTIFSAFSLDTALLVERHSYALATGYIAGSVGLSIAALFLGLAIFERRIVLP